MKTATVMTILLVLTLAFSAAADDARTITAIGRAAEKVKADAAYVTLYAQADGILMVDAVRNADKLVEAITAAVNSEPDGIRNIAVEDVALGEKAVEYWRSDQPVEPPRPQATRSIRITCAPDAERIHRLIDRGIRAGALMHIPSRTTYADDIPSVLIYGLEQSAEAAARVRKQAIENARTDAEQAAAMVGKTVGDVVSIGGSVSSGWSYPPRLMGRLTDLPTEYTGMNPDAITVSHTVAVTFELKQ